MDGFLVMTGREEVFIVVFWNLLDLLLDFRFRNFFTQKAMIRARKMITRTVVPTEITTIVIKDSLSDTKALVSEEGKVKKRSFSSLPSRLFARQEYSPREVLDMFMMVRTEMRSELVSSN